MYHFAMDAMKDFEPMENINNNQDHNNEGL